MFTRLWTRTGSRTHPATGGGNNRPRCRLTVEALEDRLPTGDVLLGAALGLGLWDRDALLAGPFLSSTREHSMVDQTTRPGPSSAQVEERPTSAPTLWPALSIPKDQSQFQGSSRRALGTDGEKTVGHRPGSSAWTAFGADAIFPSADPLLAGFGPFAGTAK